MLVTRQATIVSSFVLNAGVQIYGENALSVIGYWKLYCEIYDIIDIIIYLSRSCCRDRFFPLRHLSEITRNLEKKNEIFTDLRQILITSSHNFQFNK